MHRICANVRLLVVDTSPVISISSFFLFLFSMSVGAGVISSDILNLAELVVGGALSGSLSWRSATSFLLMNRTYNFILLDPYFGFCVSR